MKITAPYNFVPLNGQVFYPDWAEQVTQDLPFSDSEDGVIEVKLKNVSPLFTRDGSLEHFSAHIMGADGKRHYFIPATTIKGMLREIVEIMSFGKMQEDKDYQNRTFGYRDVANTEDKIKRVEYSEKVSNGKPGWLSQKEEKYYFTPCDGKLDKIPFAEIRKRYPSYKTDGSIWKSNVSVSADVNRFPMYPEIEKNGNYYQIVCTGKINTGKFNEMLFPSNRGESIEISEETIKAFKSIYAGTPGFTPQKEGDDCFLKALEKGYEIPVFYLALPNGQITLGLSRMFKLPFKYNVRQQVEFAQKVNKNKHDLGELLFGYTSKEESSKGRVQVSHAFMEGTVNDNSLLYVKGVLGTPKASYYPLYIKQTSNPYKTYNETNGIAGRKLYRIHSKDTTTQLPQANKVKNNVDTQFKAIPAGQSFTFRITLHNAKKAEIGAILSALTFNLTPGVFFNLGLAKSFGFGKCTIKTEDIHLCGFSHDLLYYMHCFEKMMTEFTYEYNLQKWTQTESIKQLANILSEHENSEVMMMELEDYTNMKKSYFSTLKEDEHLVNSLLTDEEVEEIKLLAQKAHLERLQKEASIKVEESRKAQEQARINAAKRARQDLANYYHDAETFLNENEYQKAKDCYNKIIDNLLKRGINCDEESQKIAEIEQLIANKKEEEQKLLAEQAELLHQEMLAAGLSSILDKKAGNGVDYSVKEFKVCFQKIDKWLKNSKSEKLSESDTIAVINTAKRLLENPAKKEVKELGKPFDKGNIWCKLAKYLGSDTAKELYDSYQI